MIALVLRVARQASVAVQLIELTGADALAQPDVNAACTENGLQKRVIAETSGLSPTCAASAMADVGLRNGSPNGSD